MKLNIDLGYILKRLIVIVLAFVIISYLKGCEVFAASYTNLNIVPSSFNVNYYWEDNVRHNISWASNSDLGIGSIYRFEPSIGLQSNIMRIGFGSTPVYSNYNHLKFTLYTYNVVFNNGITLLSASGVCNVSSLSNNETINSLTSSNFAYDIVCSYSSWSSSSSFNLSFKSIDDDNAFIYYYAYVTFWNETDSSSINSSITNQTNTQHQDSQNVQNAINSSDVSSDTEDNGGAIFDVDIDTSHGLSSIVTAPLTLLAKAQEQCTPKSFNIFNKSITLPCGDSLFWSKDFSSYHSIFGSGVSGSQMNTIRDNFRTFWNILFGGAIIFHLLVKLWQVINDTLDPTSDRYESLNSAIDTSSMSLRDEDELDIKKDKGSVVSNGQVKIKVPGSGGGS